MDADNQEKDRPAKLQLAGELNPEEVRRQVNLLGDEYIEGLRRGEPGNREELIRTHAALVPHLECRLKVLEAVFRATHHSSGRRSTKNSKGDHSSQDDANLLPTIDSGEGDLLIQIGELPTARDARSSHLNQLDARLIRCPHCGNQVQFDANDVQEITCGSCGSTVHVDAEATQTDDLYSIPRALGRFHVRRLLGQGAFGSVYLADDPNLSRQVAVKIPRRGFFVSRNEEQRFFQEARSAARLRHSNIVRVHEISDDPDLPFIVSEFVDGLTLSDIASGTALTFREIVEFMVQITAAVDYAHQNNVVHRDLKPGNILVDKNRNAFVSDFGLARRDDVDVTVTMDGAILGTPAYMSPEQASGLNGPVDARSDIYSLGVILYRLLCRELPFHGTKRMLMHQVIHDEPRSPRRLNDFVPKDLETITLKAMAKSPAARFQSAAEMGEELQRWLRGEPIKSRPISSPARAWRWCQRHPAVASLATAIGMLLLIGFVASLIWGGREFNLKQIANKNAEFATENRIESDARLFQLNQRNGVFSLQRNDLADAAYWFTSALEFDDDQLSRTRIGMIQDRIPKLVNLWPLDSTLTAIRFSGNGARIAAGTIDGKVRVFDRNTGATLLTQNTDGFSPVELRILPAGDRIVFRSTSNDVQIWDVDSGALISTLTHPSSVTSIDVNRDGQIVTGCEDSFLRIWNAADGTRQSEFSFEDKPVRRTRFVPDTNWIVVELRDEANTNMQTQVWDFQKKAAVGQAIGHHRSNLPYDISPDRKRMIAAAWGGNAVRVVDIETGVGIGKDVELPNRPATVFFTERADEFVTVDISGDISTWNLMTGARTIANLRTDGTPGLVSTDPNRNLIAIPDRDGTIDLVWRSTGIEACSSLRNGSRITELGFHPDGRTLAIGSMEGVLQVWDLAGSSPAVKIFQHEGKVRNALFTQDGKRCLTISTEGNAFIWDVETGRQIGQPLQHEDGIYGCDVSLNGQLFATASIDKTVKVWDVQTGDPVGGPLVHGSPVLEVSFSPDAKRLVAGCDDGTVMCWDVRANDKPQTDPVFTVKHDSKIRRVVFNAAGDQFASASDDGSVRCWDADTGVRKSGPFQHGDHANDCDFLPDGKQLVTAGANGWVYVWNLESAQIEQKLSCGAADVLTVIAGSDGRILTNENRGVSRVWRLKDGKYELASSARNSAVDACRYSQLNPDLELLGVGGGWLGLDRQLGNRGAAFLWDLENDTPFCPPLFHFGQVSSVHFNSAGTKLLTASEDRTAQLWSLDRNELPVADAKRIAGLYAQLDEGTDNRVSMMSTSKQASEFAELSKKYPKWFDCDAEEIGVWNDHRRRINEAQGN